MKLKEGRIKFQMLFEQNIASNVTRKESKHVTNSNIMKAHKIYTKARPSTQINYQEQQEIFDFHKKF